MSIIVDKAITEDILIELNSLKIDYIFSSEIKNINNHTKTHPDMQIHFVDEKNVVVAPQTYFYYKQQFPSDINIIKGCFDPGDKYPDDCLYNVVRLGNRIIGNISYIDPGIKEIYKNLNYEFVNVNQGYTKCNICIVDDNSVITEDEGIFKTLTKKGINVLKINSGEVTLSGYKYGFIGGASGFINKNTIAFCGDLKKHSDYNNIQKFIYNKKISILNLSTSKLYDYGSLLYF